MQSRRSIELMENGDGGINLTWKDLWVTVSDKREGRRAILRGLTGYVRPGQFLAIMGPSGCGKSTLLDALAGRLESNATQTGEILINGRKQPLAFGTSAYVTQDEALITTLTVKEAVFYSAELQLPECMSKSEKKERAEATIKEMGLQDSMDTRIGGGWRVKGLSGGQKRRVSICIELLTRPKLLFLDEPTSGLDSAASFHVISRIVKLAEQDRRTVFASVHQPTAEVFELFHNLCLLSCGRTLYFGSASDANQFFSSNGFCCPPMRNPSDHYLRTINQDFDVDVEQGFGGKLTAAEATNILINSYNSSETFQQVKIHVNKICQQNSGGALEKMERGAGFIRQCLVLTRRSFKNMHRDLGYYWLRFAIYIGLSLSIGTIFYDLGFSYSSIQARGSMLVFVASFMTFMAIGGFPSFVEDMKIFTRERLNGHYGVTSFVVGNTLSSIPYIVLVSIVPVAMAYYLAGLQKSIDHFIYFGCLIFACMMLVESLMMVVASIVPDFLMGIIMGAGIQGFFKNEFLGLRFPDGRGGTIGGEEVLASVWQVDTGHSKWVDLGIVFGMLILYRLMFLGVVKVTEKLKPPFRAILAAFSKYQATIDL
ncbi:ABC transporter G family member 11-like [Dorcoceras hygrometricum]|nr:ABC transporter G family member 11-like [Dorcoceras hygrometricum]